VDVVAERLTKRFTGPHGTVIDALRAVDLVINRGEFFVLVGDSGSGKTTLMRCVAGLEEPDGGSIVLRDRTVFSSAKGVSVPPQDRGIGMVFQSYAIWPHLTVYENVALPLRYGRNKTGKLEVDRRVREALRLVGLEALADRPAPHLSGGQQQRVALARGIAVSSTLLLMDEPMSNLDARLREEVRTQIRAVTRHYGTTVLYVTHDQVEAMSLADRMALMRGGEILQSGTPQELYERSMSREIAEFFGPMNFLAGKGESRDAVDTKLGRVAVAGHACHGAATLGIRPEHVRLGADARSGVNVFTGRIKDCVFLGAAKIYQIEIGGMDFRVDSFEAFQVGDVVQIGLPPDRIRVFPA